MIDDLRTVVFTDLDDTLFQTERKFPAGMEMCSAAVDNRGTPASFSTPQQLLLVRRIMHEADVIPVTGRTDKALALVNFPFRSFRITHHGAISRCADGSPTEQWQQIFSPLLEAAAPVLIEAEVQIQKYCGSRLRARIHRAEDLGVITYLSVKCVVGAEQELKDTMEQLASSFSDTLTLHHNDRNAALLVCGAGKKEAVEMLLSELRRKGPLLSLGLGDSVSDAPFMSVCDFAITPQGSQLQQAFWE